MVPKLEHCFNEHRSFIMGMSILGIVLLHTNFDLPSAITAVRRTGYMYVDLFMLLSGYGLYMSLLKKEQSLSVFYKKRLIRIAPTYYILAVVYIIYKMATDGILFTEIVGVLTTLSFWSDQKVVFSWFGQAIFAFYLLAPIAAALVRRCKSPMLLFLMSFLFVIPFLTTPSKIFAVARIPAFVLGMCFAKTIRINELDVKSGGGGKDSAYIHNRNHWSDSFGLLSSIFSTIDNPSL